MRTPFLARFTGLAIIGLTTCLIGAACGSSNHSGSGGSTGSPGRTYSVMLENIMSGPQFGNTGASTPAFAAAFHGTDAKLILCDDKGTPAGNLICQHQAAQDHVAVIIAGHQVDESVANQAGIPVVGVTDATTPVSFEVSGAPALFAGMAVALYNKGCRKLGFIATEGAQIYETQVSKSEPWQSVTVTYLPIAAPDVSASVAKLSDAGVQCIAEVALASQIVQLGIALHQADVTVPVDVPGIIITPQVIQSLGAYGNGIIEIVSSPDPSFPTAAITSVVNKIKAYDASAPIQQTELLGWAFAQVVLDAAANIKGSVNASSMLTALNNLRNANTDGIIPPISMIPRAVANDRRDFDTEVQTYTIENGHVTQPSGWFDVGAALDRSVS